MERRLRSINQGAQIMRASRASVDVSFVTGVNMEDTEVVIAEVQSLAPLLLLLLLAPPACVLAIRLHIGWRTAAAHPFCLHHKITLFNSTLIAEPEQGSSLPAL